MEEPNHAGLKQRKDLKLFAWIDARQITTNLLELQSIWNFDEALSLLGAVMQGPTHFEAVAKGGDNAIEILKQGPGWSA